MAKLRRQRTKNKIKKIQQKKTCHFQPTNFFVVSANLKKMTPVRSIPVGTPTPQNAGAGDRA